MTAASEIVAKAEARLLSGIRESRNKLAAAVSDTTSASLSFTYDLGPLQAAAAVYVDLEGFYTWAVDTSAKTATVERGQFGTTAATHAINSIAHVNPRFPKPDIFQAVNDELADLSSPANGLFRVRTVDLTYNVATVGYDLTGVTNVDQILEVQAKYPWLTGNWEPVRRFTIDRNANTTDFPSGVALYLQGGGYPGNTLRVVYKDKFTALTALSDDVNTAGGLPATCNDILILGAQLRMMTPRESKRSFPEAQGDPRRAEEVPPNAARSSIAPLAALRQARIADEAARLHRQYPMRRQGR